MIDGERARSMMSRLVGRWHGTMLHRTEPALPFSQLPGTSENRWVLGGRFVEMTLRAGASGDAWSAVFYVGYERSECRHVLVSLEPGDRRISTRLGDWRIEQDRLVLTSPQSRAVCDLSVPGRLKIELVDEMASGKEFVRFIADCRMAAQPVVPKPPAPREHRRFVIA
jgi:hypothetical protein